MKNIRAWLAAVAAALSLPAAAGQYSDLWYDPQESGWGVNVVQQLETAFVTLFVYGPDGKPTWYVASDARVIAYQSGGGRPIFAGTLYRTEGSYHGGAFDPARFKIVPVGTISLQALDFDRMRVFYTVEGAPEVVKEVVRQTWDIPIVAANYAAQFIMREAQPNQPPYGTRLYQADVLVHLDAGQAFIRVDDHLGIRCEYRGPFTQAGKLARITGEFTCDGGDAPAGTFELSDFEVTDHAVSGYLRTYAAARIAYGRFAAARY